MGLIVNAKKKCWQFGLLNSPAFPPPQDPSPFLSAVVGAQMVAGACAEAQQPSAATTERHV